MTPLCRSCNAPSSQQMVKGKNVFGSHANQHFWLCNVCGMIYLDPPLSEQEEALFYKKEFEKFMANRAGNDVDWSGPDQHVRTNQREVERRIPFLLKYLKPGWRVLELGCSSGFMLNALKNKGMKVAGIEPSGNFIDYVRGKGISVFESSQELKKEGFTIFDAIIHYYVLEHIRYPVDFINEYMTFLSRGGVMIFEVPCATDPLIELYKVAAFDNFYWSAAHHWYFTHQSLTNLLRRTKFTFELYPEQRYDLSNHMTWMLDGKPGGFGRWSDIFGEVMDSQYKECFKKNWLCDTLVAVVKKDLS
jgi:SAM-dependent methyltransferase